MRRQSRQREYSRKHWESELVAGFASFLLGARNRTVLIMTHRNADPDAVGAAVGVAELLRLYGGKPRILLPEGPSKSGKRVLEEAGAAGILLGEPSDSFDYIIIVDTANISQLDPLVHVVDRAGRIVVIDHHDEGDLGARATQAIIVREAASTSEIIAYAAKLLRAPLSPQVSTSLLAGIMSDSKSLRITGPFTAEAVGYLLDRGADPGSVYRMGREARERDTSERIALLKAASRLRYARACGDILVAVTHVGSFESSVARALLELGADVAVVAKTTRDGVRLSVRTSPRAEASGVTALELAKFIAEKLGGEAGGHRSAAAVTVKTQLMTAEDAADRVSKSLPGKVSRLCVAVRKSGG